MGRGGKAGDGEIALPLKFLSMSVKRWLLGIIGIGVVAWYLFALPQPLFHSPTSTVLEDRDGRLMGARIAGDGQWRFPVADTLPEKYVAAVLAFEDKRFFSHPGIDPVAVGRAMWQNLSQGRLVSGASTLTMQVIRLSRKEKPRTVIQKIIEAALAVRAELRYSKQEILTLYASHAPFGGNVVGLDGAAWRYFGVPPQNLSWGQTAALAVLPNAPSMVRPGKNEKAFRDKRNRLLTRLFEKEIIDSLTHRLACDEPLPGIPLPLPQEASHLLNRVVRDGKEGQRITTTLRLPLQQKAQEVVQQHHRRLEANNIHNMGALILEVESGEVMAYIGNTTDQDNRHQNKVDVVEAPRSSGSTLKPFLYAAMLQEGLILPQTLVADVPFNLDGYSPKNFSNRYDGAVHAGEVLYRSLNVPMVRMLRQYGLSRFHHLLHTLEFSTITRPAGHYGLSLILGGSEATLWELAGAYASMARVLMHLNSDKQYLGADFHLPHYTDTPPAVIAKKGRRVLSAAAIYTTFETLTNPDRPEQESGWKFFTSSRKIAWKTGTSFGFRDGWAIGVTPQYVVAVWAGNADGEGRPGLTGLSAAAPAMMDLFRLLPATTWFKRPWDELIEAEVCPKSGHLAGPYCHPADTVLIPENGILSSVCPYHRLVHLDSTQNYRVDASCYPADKMVHTPWFVLPPVMEWYYRRANASYTSLPPLSSACTQHAREKVMEIIYPEKRSKVFIPTELGGSPGKVVFKAAHRNPKATVFWFIDRTYYGATTGEHQLAIHPAPGKHILTLTDKEGNTAHTDFEVAGE